MQFDVTTLNNISKHRPYLSTKTHFFTAIVGSSSLYFTKIANF